METGKAKLEEIQTKTFQSSKSDNSTSSSNFSFEADSSTIELDRTFPHNCFEFQRQKICDKIENMVLRYNNCFVCLQQAFTEVNLLREENLNLRAEHLHLSMLVAAKENEIMSSFLTGRKSVSDFRQNGLSSDVDGGTEVSEVQLGMVENQKPPSGTTKIKEEEIVTRGALPKVISIRSSGFMAMNNNQSVGGPSVSKCAGSTSGANRPHRLRLTAKASQEGGGEEEVELEVYNQGMLKTELCNKWEETGCCPYGDRCQFAHGIEELRPVIRHPRYKTELCRMIIHGGTCPYGHRCHFRHALDPNKEKEVLI